MDILTIVSQSLKFIGILIGSLSGIIGIFGETTDKITGKLTKLGKRILTILVISGFVTLAVQVLETQQNIKRLAKQDELDKTAQDARDSELKTLSHLSESLANISVQQKKTLVETWRLQHPLGNWTCSLSFSIPVDHINNQYILNWIDNLKMSNLRNDPSTIKMFGILNVDDDQLKHSIDSDSRLGFFDFSYSISVFLRTSPSQSSDSAKLLPRTIDDLILGVTLEKTKITILFDKTTYLAKEISISVLGLSKGFGYTGMITNWIDLYGGEIIIEISKYLPKEIRLSSFSLYYDDTNWPRKLRINLNKIMKYITSESDSGVWIAYVGSLNVYELGLIPDDYPGDIPVGYNAEDYRPL